MPRDVTPAPADDGISIEAGIYVCAYIAEMSWMSSNAAKKLPRRRPALTFEINPGLIGLDAT